MNLSILLQRWEYNGVRDEYCKNETKIALLSQYSVSFSGRHDEVVYILVSIKIRVGKYMDSFHYVCDVLDNIRGRWWNCNNDTITNYSGYLKNVYDILSNKNKKGEEIVMNRSDRIVSMLYIKYTFLYPEKALFVLRIQYPNILKILRIE